MFVAASLSATKATKTLPTLIAIYIGLVLSDLWKYWIGWFALKNKRAAAFAEKKHVIDLKDKVQTYTLTTMIAARFIPLTRVPAYVACGFFRINYLKYCLYIALTALLYVTIIFGTIHGLGSLFGEKLKFILPIIGLTFLIGAIVTQLVQRKRAQS